MKIVYMGTPEFAVTILDKLILAGHQIMAVVTQPDKPKGRGNRLLPPPVKVRAMELDLPVLQPIKVKEEIFLEALRQYDADVFVVAAYGKILPQRILDMPKYGCINVHGSLLPKYRGAAPIQRAVLNGETQTGVTIMQMNIGMDTGDMLAKSAIDITKEDTTGTIFARLADLGGDLLVKTLKALEAGEIKPIAQNEAEATYAPPLTKEEEKIDWSKSAEQIVCQIRGLAPAPCAYSICNGQRIKIKAASVQSIHTAQISGEIVELTAEGIVVACGQDAVCITQLQPAGKKMMSARDFLNGSSLRQGMVFDG